MKAFLQKTLGPRLHRELSQTVNSLKRIVRPKHEPEVFALNQFVSTGDVALEVGANYAQYTRVLSSLVGESGHVYAFEPADITFRCLRRNCRLLGLGNVTPKRLALADQSGTTSLFTPMKRAGVFGVAQASLEPDPRVCSEQEQVPVDTIDNFVQANGISTVSFIRCDVEGAEMNVLLGASMVFDRHRPIVLVEAHDDFIWRFGYSLDDLSQWFSRRGYFFRVFHRGALNDIESVQHGNVFCLPSERRLMRN